MDVPLWEPFSGDPLLVAPPRAARPHDIRVPAEEGGPPCPFCEGCEGLTTSEVLAYRPTGTQADRPGWRVRAFPNMYPVVTPDAGVHEVIVNHPRHLTNIADLSDDDMALAVAGWARRLEAAGDDPRGLWPFLFLNQGALAGASLQHTHAQLVGLPFAPPRLVRREMAFHRAPSCPLCADLAAPGDRVVAEMEGLVAWCPAVPPVSGLVRLAPRRHVPGWWDVIDPGAVGRVVRRVARAVRTAMGVDDLNLWLHQGRRDDPGRYHWHLEMVPRVGTFAGLELGAGVLPVTREPAELAGTLRAAF